MITPTLCEEMTMGRMTRNDYLILSTAVIEARQAAQFLPHKEASEAAVRLVAERIASGIHEYNRGFDPARFFRDCGYEPVCNNR